MKKLENKVAVIYGDGSVGGATAKAFAKEGAHIFLTGRTLSKLDAIAAEILSEGGAVETTKLDALDENAVEEHMAELITQTGKIDISFNAVGIPQKGIQGVLLTELSVENFLLPVTTYTKAHLVTSRAYNLRTISCGDGGHYTSQTPNHA